MAGCDGQPSIASINFVDQFIDEQVEEEKTVRDIPVYDLHGRKIQNAAAKGVYIVNGKKVIK